MTVGDAATPLLAAYLRRRADLLRYFRLRLRSDDAAEDLVQEIYLRAAAIPPETEIRHPDSYLYKLGSNLMLDRLRHRQSAARRDYDWRDAHTHGGGLEGLSPEPAADRVLAARQQLARIVAVLRELPPMTQEVFRLHKFEGLTHLETAARLGISRSAVEKHVMSVLRRLEREFPR